MFDIIVTNNPLVCELNSDKLRVDYRELTFNDLLKVVRDYVHNGHRLLSHPLSGSVKPNENPYKSVMLTGQTQSIDLDSVTIIENAIFTARKFPVKFKVLSKEMARDFQIIDKSLISS